MGKIRELFNKLGLHHVNYLTLDIVRWLPMLLLMVAAFWPDMSTFLVVRYVFGFLFAIGLIVHFLRKLMFPYIDLKEVGNKAVETPIGAAIIFASVSIIICTIIFVTAGFFK